MIISSLKNMEKGWFIGNFSPSLFKTNEVEVAVKYYSAGDTESKHYHKIATEYTVIVQGKIRMFDREFSEGDIVVCEPGEMTDFCALTDAINVVVKLPGANNDKYVCENFAD